MSPPSPLPAVGSLAPDFTVTSARGAELRLADLRGTPVLLVFLRHLGCPICKLELATMQRRQGEIAARGVRLFVFVDSADASVAEYGTRHDVRFELVADPTQRIYHLYGVKRGGPLAMLAPGAAAKAVKATAQGFMHGKFEGSELQLPGDFVVGRDGRVLFAHLGKHVGDNTALDALLRYV